MIQKSHFESGRRRFVSYIASQTRGPLGLCIAAYSTALWIFIVDLRCLFDSSSFKRTSGLANFAGLAELAGVRVPPRKEEAHAPMINFPKNFLQAASQKFFPNLQKNATPELARIPIERNEKAKYNSVKKKIK